VQIEQGLVARLRTANQFRLDFFIGPKIHNHVELADPDRDFLGFGRVQKLVDSTRGAKWNRILVSSSGLSVFSFLAEPRLDCRSVTGLILLTLSPNFALTPNLQNYLSKCLNRPTVALLHEAEDSSETVGTDTAHANSLPCRILAI
jgi:hypothetical protein